MSVVHRACHTTERTYVALSYVALTDSVGLKDKCETNWSSFMKPRYLLTLPLLLSGVLMSGCATNSELAKVRTEVREVRTTADQALALAQEANRRSERTEEMLHRSYQHSMRK